MRKHAAMLAVAWLAGGGLAAAQEPAPMPGWIPGPTVGKLGQRASINVPDGFFFLDQAATKKFLEDNQNIPDGNELGTIVRLSPDSGQHWFAVFSYSDTGHIKDDEKDRIDAAALMQNMQAGNREANEARQKRGWAPLDLEGWHQPPFYNASTHNLTWATRLTSEGQVSINHSVRLLGRTGLMSAQLVADPGAVDVSIAEFDQLLSTYAFNEGFRYAEFRPGDKLAAYGLTALIAGGAGATAVKTGLFKKLWKVIVFALVAVAGAVKKLFSGFGAPPRTERPVPVVPPGPRPA
jgi:uncharacterized membrane-anchored protein